MSAPTGRRRAIAKALTALLPLAPYADMEKIRTEAGSVHMKSLPPTIAVWLATIAHVRHVHTDYEKLLAEGYDRDSARFFVIEQKLYFKKPTPSASPIVTLMYGKNLRSYSTSVDISNQVGQFIVRGSDPKTREPFQATSQSVNKYGTNGRTGKDIMSALTRQSVETVYSDATSQAEAQTMANALANERAMNLISGEGESIGIPELRAGRNIKLEGLGPKFNQTLLLVSVTHQISNRGYVTQFRTEGNAF